MRRLALVFLFVPCVALAQEYDRFLLPVTPSTVSCAYNSRYDTRLLLFNDSGSRIAPLCFAVSCDPVEAGKGRVVEGPYLPVPLPSFMYVPKGKGLSAKLEVESSHTDGTDRFFTEIPVVGESEFRDRIELLGVRVDGAFRQTLRIFGREEDAGTTVHMYIYDVRTGALVHEHRHTMYVYPVSPSSEIASSPSFSMECNLHELDHALSGQQFRIVLVPEDRPAKIWAFISVTNNTTQHFYNVLPE